MKWLPVILLLLGTIGLVTAAYMMNLSAGVAATGVSLMVAGVFLYDPDRFTDE